MLVDWQVSVSTASMDLARSGNTRGPVLQALVEEWEEQEANDRRIIEALPPDMDPFLSYYTGELFDMDETGAIVAAVERAVLRFEAHMARLMGPYPREVALASFTTARKLYEEQMKDLRSSRKRAYEEDLEGQLDLSEGGDSSQPVASTSRGNLSFYEGRGGVKRSRTDTDKDEGKGKGKGKGKDISG